MPDPILFWNHVALEANRISHTNGQDEQTGPTLSSRALAIVHLAMYDAYAGVINNPANLPRYISTPPLPGAGASADAAVAAAAHTTLSNLFPSQKPFFDLILSGVGDPADPGHGFGGCRRPSNSSGQSRRSWWREPWLYAFSSTWQTSA
jgi:hypothetical protein